LICVPRPDSADGIPIWFGSSLTPRLVRRVVQSGVGWMPFIGPEPKPLEMIARGTALVREGFLSAGRDPSSLEVSCLFLPRGRPFEQALEEEVSRLKAAGATHLRVQASMFCASLDAVPAFVKDLVRRLEGLS
jgi:alkanesulfonate monooxygenase SsuD/methylene tetrahydromethanopterin reductase-like flavin-dependent oxidoreductase (luciferase family)